MAYDNGAIMQPEELKKNMLIFLNNLIKEIEQDTMPIENAHIEFEPEHEESPAFKISGGFEFKQSPYTGYVDMILGLRYFDKEVENYETVSRLFEGWDQEVVDLTEDGGEDGK